MFLDFLARAGAVATPVQSRSYRTLLDGVLEVLEVLDRHVPAGSPAPLVRERRAGEQHRRPSMRTG